MYNTERISDITVVGGGDAGLITALTLKQVNPGLGIRVIDDFKQEVPAVGKSTISYILNTFHSVLDIDPARFIAEVRPVWKTSIYFEDWCGAGPFHEPFDDVKLVPPESSPQRFLEFYHRYQTDNFHTLGEELADQQLTPFIETPDGSLSRYDHIAYHLSTGRLNRMLRQLCEERDIALINDRIQSVDVGEKQITRIEGNAGSYDADLYIDATGFNRTLRDKLDADYHSFDFHLDSAVVGRADISISEIEPCTVVNSMDNGWTWQIDTYDGRDLGYVYSSKHVSDDMAAQEFLSHRDESLSRSEIDVYEFDSGYYECAWEGNCVAVGNALGFVEPLQSTALTLNAILTERLACLLADHNHLNHQGIRSMYNSYARSQWRNIHSFINLHYQYSSGDTEFWEDMRSLPETEELTRHVESYRRNGFVAVTEAPHGVSRGKDDQTSQFFGRFIYSRLLKNLNVSSDLYDTVDIDVDAEIKTGIQDATERVKQDAGRHLSYDEIQERGVYQGAERIR